MLSPPTVGRSGLGILSVVACENVDDGRGLIPPGELIRLAAALDRRVTREGATGLIVGDVATEPNGGDFIPSEVETLGEDFLLGTGDSFCRVP